jgi:hypothetical protein
MNPRKLKELSEIKKTMQDTKEKFIKDMGVLKKNKIESLEMKTSISPLLGVWLKWQTTCLARMKP